MADALEISMEIRIYAWERCMIKDCNISGNLGIGYVTFTDDGQV